jgi:hypothetical protein
MKFIFLSTIIILHLYGGIFDFFSKKDESTNKVSQSTIEQKIDLKKLREFEQNIEIDINNDLKALNGYLDNEVIKNFSNDSAILKKFNKCYQNEKTDLIKGNVGTRIYTINCWKEFKKDYYTIFNETYINNLIKKIDLYLTKKYNLSINKKATILNINPKNFQKKQLYYSLDTIPNAKREFIHTISDINNNWDDVLKNVNTYDQSFGWLDNMKLLYLETLLTPGDTTREEAVKNYKQSIKSIYNTNHTFLKLLTNDIKEKYKEDILTQLSSMYADEY